MWHPIKIEIYDLFAHRESIYEFKNNACTVIFGRNETDRGMDNNGAGKTTLFEAIVLALTNKSLRDIKRNLSLIAIRKIVRSYFTFRMMF